MGGKSIPASGIVARRAPKRLLALRGDDHLVERLRAGDDGAFEVLYERHVAAILSFCRHMLGSAEEAEDAVQQTFASAHRDLLRDGREIHLKAWLYTIARNRCLSFLRARREERQLGDEASLAGLGDEVSRRADLRELVSDLQDLPPDQRSALVLAELGDLSHAEIAEVIDVEERKVKGLVFRARSGLVERRDARSADCDEIRAELEVARRGAFRRGRLRHHLKACPGCSAYLADVRRQRKMMALVLPVIPTIGLKNSVLAATGLGGAAAGAGGGFAGLAGIPAVGATLAKVAVVGALAGSAGVAGEAVLGGDDPEPQSRSTPAEASPKGAPPGLGAAPAEPGSVTAPGGKASPGTKRGKRGRKGRRRGAGTPGAGRLKGGSPPRGKRVPPRARRKQRLNETGAKGGAPAAAPRAPKPKVKVPRTPQVRGNSKGGKLQE